MTQTLSVIDHPLIKHKVTLLRSKETSTGEFRRILREVSLLLAYDATRDLELSETEIETPLERGRFPILEGKKLCFVSILRAGNGLLDGMLDLVPSARVGFIGLYRDHKTLEAVEYYFKVPELLPERLVIVVDPMLATGHSAIAAITRLKKAGAKRIKFVCLVAAPEGAKAMADAHPDVPILAAALDRQLNEKGYILPGLGDAGDRIYGTA
ncbi:MAG TPA: uracil phosphoribosyltransferase [Amphiplicatus sp.]|nr:uracil phosphoribosyltransferase [Caulobacterales bacterium]HOP19704.1 uracil phosphoribosyltransferase [Amphiplicatus sp.]